MSMPGVLKGGRDTKRQMTTPKQMGDVHTTRDQFGGFVASPFVDGVRSKMVWHILLRHVT